MNARNIFVIGASAEGIKNLSSVLQALPRDFPGSLFVVLHLAPDSVNAVPAILQRSTALQVKSAEDSEAIRDGVVYIAVPDRHLLVTAGRILVKQGPRENRWRPAIDPLFRSAAATYGPRVTGVILSGLLDDGSSGLWAVKQCGGTAVVQDPQETRYNEMPKFAIRATQVDHVLPVASIGPLLLELSGTMAGAAPPVPQEVRRQVDLLAPPGIAVAAEERQTSHETNLTCPECGGPLRLDGPQDLPHYRCAVGHQFSHQSLLAEHKTKLERALWTAVRMFEERASLFFDNALRERDHQREKLADSYEERAAQARADASILRQVLLGGVPTPPTAPDEDQ